MKYRYKKYAGPILTLWAVLFLSGCSFMLPSARQLTETPWQSYEDVKKSYDQIIPGRTTLDDLKKIGFNPFETPNMQFLNYLDIIERFMPNQSIRVEDLDPAIQKCLRARDQCSGYRITPELLSNKRYGNLFLDLFNFNRKTKTSGWRFEALIVMMNRVVIYKLSSGQPNVSRDENKKNPLGPLQDIQVQPPSINLPGS